MKKTRKFLCLMLVLCTLISVAVPAMATEVNEGIATRPSASGLDNLTGVITTNASGENRTFNAPHQGDADTYNGTLPEIEIIDIASNLTIPYGETAELNFLMLCTYANQAWVVNIYDRYNNVVASGEETFYNSESGYRTLTIKVDTASLAMTPGQYTVQYYMEYYDGGWKSITKQTVKLKVLENKCNGNHNYKLKSVWEESTCDMEGIGFYVCSRCGNEVYDLLELAEHTYDNGVVAVNPTDNYSGMRLYTCTVCGAVETETIPALKTAPAKPYKITNVVSGVHVYWNAVEGARKYGLWRSETGKDGTYKWVANPTVPHFTDTTVQSGKTYHYKVTIMNTDYNTHTNKSESIGITYVSTPDITARYNKAAGVKLEWQKIAGATGYAIYRKSYSGTDDWVRVATISGNATFTWTDTSVKNENGTAYKYTIRALAGSNMKTLSGCRNTGRSMVRLTSRTLNSALIAGKNAITCCWNTSSAVTGYEVRFMVDGVVYKTFTVANCKTGTKTFTGLPAGQTYKIQVRSYKKIDGMGFYSAWSTAKEVTL